MTARDDVRRSRAEVRDADRAYAAEAGPSLPERLLAARERKGVDLFRAERDTKIRARYLDALERGDYAELPGAVYTKGFLRNYALYLGLDPEELTRQWKRERGDLVIPAEPVLAVPRPLDAPRPGLTFSPVLIVAALLTVLIGVFAIYIGVQLFRFAKPPTLAVTSPAQAVIDVPEDSTSYTLRGTSVAGASVTITAAGRDQPYHVNADGDGLWSADVDLRRGRNEFSINAVDPDTGKPAEQTVKIFITVPFVVIEAPRLAVDSPGEGSEFQNGAIPVHGTASNAATVSVTATRLGDPGSSPAPAPTPTAKPDPSASPAAGPVTVGPVTVTVADDGTFDTPLDLSAGTWQIVVTAASADGKLASLTRHVTVAYLGVTLVIRIQGGTSWITAKVDGKYDPQSGPTGILVREGKPLTLTAQQSISVRTGLSGLTYFTLNGQDLGRLSTKNVTETWVFAPPAPPVKTDKL
jgi:cytoskeletal protein RodZ